MTLPKDLREFVELLDSLRIEYLVVGSFAVAKHGHPRSTGDIDLLVRTSLENATKLQDAFNAFGLESLGLKAEDFQSPGQIIQIGRPPNRIDIMTSISGVEFEEAWASREVGEIDGVPTLFISKELLVRNKRATGRAKDLADLAELEGA